MCHRKATRITGMRATQSQASGCKIQVAPLYTCGVRIFTRYILREVLAHAVIGTVLFTFVVFMRDVSRILELVVRNSAPLPSVAEIFFLALPSALTVTIPMGVLVGIFIW